MFNNVCSIVFCIYHTEWIAIVCNRIEKNNHNQIMLIFFAYPCVVYETTNYLTNTATTEREWKPNSKTEFTPEQNLSVARGSMFFF